MQKWLPPGTKLPPTQESLRINRASRRKSRERIECNQCIVEKYFPDGKAKPFSYLEKQDSSHYFKEASDRVLAFFGKPLYEPLVVKERRGRFSGIGHVSAYAFDDGSNSYIHLSGEATPYAIAHELVHAQDAFLIGELILQCGGKIPREKVTLAYTEGRASFLQDRMAGTNTPKDVRQTQALVMGLALIVAGAAAASYSGFVGWALSAFSILAGACYCGRKSKYVPFSRALREIEREVGSAVAAFRITSQKLPQKMRDIRRPLEFYKSEIAEEKAKQAQA